MSDKTRVPAAPARDAAAARGHETSVHEKLAPDPAAARERGYYDWRRRLTRNLSRRSDGRWDPLTYMDDGSSP